MYVAIDGFSIQLARIRVDIDCAADDVQIELTGPLTPEQRAKLMEIADKCPVHQTLTSEINIKTRAV